MKQSKEAGYTFGPHSLSSPVVAEECCDKCHFKKVCSRCSKCKTAKYCSKECQTTHWQIHKPICRPYSPKEVWGINILSNREVGSLDIDEHRKRYRHQLVQTDHPVFTRGELCPVPALFGIPLLIYSPSIATGIDIEDAGNQPAVYLRIEPQDGLAPPVWQMFSPGTCLVVRKDKKPLTLEVIETIVGFHRKLIQSFGYPKEDGWAPVRDLMTPAVFQMFSRDYYEEQQEKGRVGFDPFYEPL